MLGASAAGRTRDAVRRVPAPQSAGNSDQQTPVVVLLKYRPAGGAPAQSPLSRMMSGCADHPRVRHRRRRRRGGGPRHHRLAAPPRCSASMIYEDGPSVAWRETGHADDGRHRVRRRRRRSVRAGRRLSRSRARLPHADARRVRGRDRLRRRLSQTVLRRPLGLRARWKFLLLFVLAAGFVAYEAQADPHHFTSLWFTGWVTLAPWLWALLAVSRSSGAANAVNLTDGLDGLAAGTAIPAAAAARLHGAEHARGGGRRSRDGLPLLQHASGAHLHGRHRLARARRTARRAGDPDGLAAAARRCSASSSWRRRSR